jgi:Uma2 family endonuclease
MAQMHAIPLREDDVFYPESDGQPMGESELHRDEIVYLIEAFKERFQGEPEVYVGGNLFLYYRRGDPRDVICPDVMVVQGVPKLPKRRIYKLWDEGESPCLAMEVRSDSTAGNDFVSKKALYESLGIDEYVLYDPLALRLPQIRGFRLADDGQYQPVAPGPDGSLASQTTGVTFRLEGQSIRVVETATGRRFLRPEEKNALLDDQRDEIERVKQAAFRREEELAAAQQAASREKEARLALEEEIARLRREIERQSKR